MTNEHGAATTEAYGTYSPGHLAAFAEWQRLGIEGVTAESLFQLCEDRHFVDAVQQERQRRAKAAAPVPAAPRPAAPQARRKYWTAGEFDAWTNAVIGFVGADLDLLKDEQVCAEYEKPLTAALEAHYGTPAAAHDMNGLLFPVMLLLQVVARKNRDKRELLEAETRRLESLLVLYEHRIAALESGGTTARGLSWAGEFAPGHSYRAGEFCKRAGSIWLATRQTNGEPELSSGNWQLVLKAPVKP